jgi:hypothetical protein
MKSKFSSRRTVVLACAALSAAMLPTVSVQAADHANGCPTGYELFQADDAHPAAQQVDARGNGDGWACRKPMHQGSYNVIDNRVQS